MTGWLILVSAVVSEALHAAACMFLIYRLLHTKRPFGGAVLAGAAGISIIAAADVVSNGFHISWLIMETVWLVFCVCRFLHADFGMGLYISIYFGIAVELWQFLFSAGMWILFEDRHFWDLTSMHGQAVRWLLNLFLAALAVYAAGKPDMAGKEAFQLSMVIALAGFFAVITLSTWNVQNGRVIPEDTIYMWVVLAVVLLMAVLIFRISRQYEMEKELAKLKSEQARLLERDYTALNRAYAVNARLFHDLHNHIGALRQFLAHEKYQEAVQYLNGLQKPVQEMADTVWTGDDTADYLINSLAAAAAASQIQLSVQVEFPRHTNICSADLCAVLGNLLDNAREAAGQVNPPEKRRISLTIRRINQMIVIKVENSYTGAARQEKGELKTTKTEDGLHGWGLKSVQAAVQKYDGIVQTSYEGERFLAVATLFFEGRL